ncbi:hypothetical protein SAMN04490357_0996 [Streptomyces misionensis]|uniref:Uncharacterized protein n=1 Tax=Streptomyces misionensis TaxID=67331 RepID=A0A1H4P5W1_9ACTN|nr:hypothetical protein [Streptomyces misionensis]SEC02694.1 hypothetical protein SAMN04490357_0996 [Streptomyces misionensis]
MGLYHSVSLAYGFEIPADTDLDLIDQVIGDGPDLVKDSVGHHVIGDYDQMLLVTRFTTVAENTVVRLTADTLASVAELAAWDSALDDVAARLGCSDHPEPAWLVIHNYR